ncbi:hypothetical protein BDZ91DRAFT_714146 [Kalaharituber pfeilii]|nr:hypothetical protein BDZ91DRAFT_714146 [Kalaharituber pfeilii]
MSLLKCDQTGHFFVYYPEHDIGFTCFECLEDFGSSGRRPANVGYTSTSSRKRRTLHLSPPPPSQQGQSESVQVSGRDEFGRRRSKPWRCLQIKCKLLACDSCAELLINPAYISKARDRKVQEIHSNRMDCQSQNESSQRAGDATPPECRAARELRMESSLLGKPALATLESVPLAIAAAESSKVEADSKAGSDNDNDGPLEELRTKLVYRRAGHVATSALAHYHHRIPGRASTRPPPVFQKPAETPFSIREAAKRSSTLAPHPVRTPPSATRLSMPVLEVDSAENSDDDMDIMPKLPVRSAAQAANQAMRTVHLKRKERSITAGQAPAKIQLQ